LAAFLRCTTGRFVSVSQIYEHIGKPVNTTVSLGDLRQAAETFEVIATRDFLESEKEIDGWAIILIDGLGHYKHFVLVCRGVDNHLSYWDPQTPRAGPIDEILPLWVGFALLLEN
jgi:hypothetical protein